MGDLHILQGGEQQVGVLFQMTPCGIARIHIHVRAGAEAHRPAAHHQAIVRRDAEQRTAYVFGFRVGAMVGVLSETIWSFMSPVGMAGPVAPFLIVGEVLFALAGWGAAKAWAGQFRLVSPYSMFIGATMAICAFFWDPRDQLRNRAVRVLALAHPLPVPVDLVQPAHSSFRHCPRKQRLRVRHGPGAGVHPSDPESIQGEAVTSSRGTFYGVVAVLVALLILVSTFAIYYYGQDQQALAQNQNHVEELSTALASYSALSGEYNSSLVDYNATLSLLSTAVGNLNTSTPAYRNASLALSSLWAAYQRLASYSGRRVLVYGVHVFVDFGNATRRWYNDTRIQPGWNGYVATLVLLGGDVQAVWYPQYGEHLVTGLGGVSQASATSWFFWEFGGGGWSLAPTGADGLQMDNGTTVAWTLCGYDSNFNPTCTP